MTQHSHALNKCPLPGYVDSSFEDVIGHTQQECDDNDTGSAAIRAEVDNATLAFAIDLGDDCDDDGDFTFTPTLSSMDMDSYRNLMAEDGDADVSDGEEREDISFPADVPATRTLSMKDEVVTDRPKLPASVSFGGGGGGETAVLFGECPPPVPINHRKIVMPVDAPTDENVEESVQEVPCTFQMAQPAQRLYRGAPELKVARSLPNWKKAQQIRPVPILVDVDLIEKYADLALRLAADERFSPATKRSHMLRLFRLHRKEALKDAYDPALHD
jgi:hypothetical protein